MNPQTQSPEPQEFPLQERTSEAPSDSSLPAAQILTEQSQESDENTAATRFIP